MDGEQLPVVDCTVKVCIRFVNAFLCFSSDQGCGACNLSASRLGSLYALPLYIPRGAISSGVLNTRGKAPFSHRCKHCTDSSEYIRHTKGLLSTCHSRVAITRHLASLRASHLGRAAPRLPQPSSDARAWSCNAALRAPKTPAHRGSPKQGGGRKNGRWGGAGRSEEGLAVQGVRCAERGRGEDGGRGERKCEEERVQRDEEEGEGGAICPGRG